MCLNSLATLTDTTLNKNYVRGKYKGCTSFNDTTIEKLQQDLPVTHTFLLV